MRLIELINGEIYERAVSNTNRISVHENIRPIGKTKDLESIISENPADTLVVVRKNLLQTALQNGGSVDSSTAQLRDKLSRHHIRSGRELGLIVLSDPEQTWVEKISNNPYSYKFKRVNCLDEATRPQLLIKDPMNDSKIVIATPRQEEIDKQIASILDHFSKVINLN